MQFTPSIFKTLIASICVFIVYVLIVSTITIRQKYFPEIVTQTILYLCYMAICFVMVANIGIVSMVIYHWYITIKADEWDPSLMGPGLVSDILVVFVSTVLTYFAYHILKEGA